MAHIRLVTSMYHHVRLEISCKTNPIATLHLPIYSKVGIPFCVKNLLHMGHRNCLLIWFRFARLAALLVIVLDIRRWPVETVRWLCIVKLGDVMEWMVAWWTEAWWTCGWCRWLVAILIPLLIPPEMPAILVPIWPVNGLPLMPTDTPQLVDESNECLASAPSKFSEFKGFIVGILWTCATTAGLFSLSSIKLNEAFNAENR